MNATDRERLQTHVETLGAALGTVMVQRRGMAGMMYVEFEPPKIEGPIIEAQKDYFIMLHELGHVAHGHTQGRPPFEDKTFYFDNGVLKSEAEAWDWAMNEAFEDPTPETARFMWHFCMGSYYSGSRIAGGRPGQQLWNGNRHYVRFRYDTPDEFFWATKDRMLSFADRAMEVA